MSRLAPLNLLESSALKNSTKLPFANSYFSSDLLKRSSTKRLVHFITFKKSRNAPRRKCGIDSATTLISSPPVFVALSMSIGSMPKVFPALVPP